MPEHTSCKSLGNYKITFRTMFDNDSGDYIVLKMRISPELRDLIKTVSLNEETEYDMYDGNQNVTLNRYKAKKWVFSSLNPGNRCSLFNKGLLDSCEADFKFLCVTSLDDFMREIKSNMKLLIQAVHNYSEINATVTFNLGK